MIYTRADDEKLLHALRLRDRGHSLSSIARAMGWPVGTVASRTRAVDLAEHAPMCAMHGCVNELSHSNRSGLCREHNHAPGFCTCGQCQRRA